MDRLINYLVRRPGRVLLSFGLLLLLAVLVTGRLHFEQDILAVLPQKDRGFAVLRHIIKASEGQELLYVLVERRDGGDVQAPAEGFRDELAGITIDGQPGFDKVSFRKDEAVSIASFAKLLDRFLERPELFLTEAEFAELESYLADPAAMGPELERSLALMATPGAGEMAGLAARDPLNLRRYLVDKLHRLQGGIRFADGPFMLAPDHSAMLLAATPAKPANQQAWSQQLLAEIDQLRTTHPELFIGLAGGYAMAAQEEAMLRSDLLSAIFGSVLGIALLFLVAYRRLLVLAFILLPLAVGLQLALGAMSLIWGRVHLIAVAFAAVVLGLGIDFAIHVYDRFASERQRGGSLEQAARSAIGRTGRAVLAGGLTTVVAFSVLVMTGSLVIQQIGWLVTLGLLCCLVTILWALPAGLIWSERRFKPKTHKPFRLLGMDRLGHLVAGYPKAVLLVSLTLLLPGLLGLPQLSVERDMMALHPQEIEAMQVREEIQHRFGSGAQPLLVAWRAGDGRALWQTGARIDTYLAEQDASGSVANWSSITRMSAGRAVAREVAEEPLQQLLANYDLELATFPALTDFLAALNNPEPLQLAGCRDFSVFPEVFQRFYHCPDGRSDGRIEGIAWLYAAGGTADSLAEGLAAIDPDILLISPKNVVVGLMAKAKTELMLTAGWAGGLVLFIVLLFFRRLSRTLLAVLPTMLGLVTTGGVMGLLGIKINLINFIIIPILLGIGLDDGIHVLDRYLESGEVERTLATTGRSILLTSLTTCLGFGSLALADYHILAGMGLLTIVGVSACFLFSALTLPALLQLFGRRLRRTV